jgi:glyoxylase-like metal-dependent hydrolase (beta-lactamase superfamily II)
MEIKTITIPFLLNVSVNCYLITAGDGYVLIDTGRGGKRKAIEEALNDAGCRPGNLRLVVLTHGDFDHSGNAAYLRRKFGTEIAMHADDAGMVELGDDEGDDLGQYGLDVQVLSIPGHSRGSIGLLTSGGDLFCGDLLANTGEPAMWSIIDDQPAAEASVQKLMGFQIDTVYPGHGQPFPMDQFTKNRTSNS